MEGRAARECAKNLTRTDATILDIVSITIDGEIGRVAATHWYRAPVAYAFYLSRDRRRLP